MNRKIFTGIAVLAMSALPLSASAWAQGGQPQADMNGDGRPDSLSLQRISDNEMLLRVGLAEEAVDVRVAGDSRGQPLRPVDYNGDGRDEVLVPTSVGANTITYSVWRYTPEQGLNPIRTGDGKPFLLFEGGGIAATSVQGCAPAGPDRLLDSVNASLNAQNTYDGSRVTFSVRDGVATPVHRIDIKGAQREDPRLQADPATCAPLA